MENCGWGFERVVGLKEFIKPLLYIFMLVVVFIVMIVFVGLISWSWVRGIDYMKENHPDYKGEDFLSTSAGRDLWDDYDEDTIHTEGEF